MKKIWILLVSMILAGLFFFGVNAQLIENPETIDEWTVITTSIDPQEWEEIITTSMIDFFGSKSFLYYYGNGCSHCAKVDAYLKGVGAYDILDIVKKDTWDRTKPENKKKF